MVSLDYSIIPAILIFLVLIFALNSLLFRPIVKVQEERARRTSGLMDQSRREVENQQNLFREYETKIRQARAEGYRLQDQARGYAAKKRAEALEQARKAAEGLIEQSRTTIAAEVRTAKEQMTAEAGEIARGIAAVILQRPA